MGCLALEYRARALLGMVEPHARWFSSPWSWSSSGFVAEAAECGLGTMLCRLSLSQPSPSRDDAAEEGRQQSQQQCRQGALQPSVGWWDPVLGCRTGEGGGGTPSQSLPWAVLVLQHRSSPLQPPKRCCMRPSGDLHVLLVRTGTCSHHHLPALEQIPVLRWCGVGEPCCLTVSISAVPLAHESFGA